MWGLDSLLALPPASACQGSHPTHCVSWCFLPPRGRVAGCSPAHLPSRAAPRRFMLRHCLQRSALRP
uniref:Uncharacterized protein n=2 Tax=Canis lupus familiaris TaxID=9615 RepID=A0A8I3RV95_CANLF